MPSFRFDDEDFVSAYKSRASREGISQKDLVVKAIQAYLQTPLPEDTSNLEGSGFVSRKEFEALQEKVDRLQESFNKLNFLPYPREDVEQKSDSNES